MANLTDADKVLRNDTGKDIASKLDAIKTAIQNQSTTLNNLSDVSILSVQDGQFLKYDSTEQRWVNVSLPDPMVFKGTLGTGGTITALPVDGSANVGDTYKVIEDGTYSGTAAKVGDLFSCLTKTSSANTWVLIPSGDESFTDTWRGIKVNGTEKLTSSISSGEVDFVEGSNIQITFDTTGNKIIISATDTTYSEATQSTSGLMSASDKTKLDTIPTTADTQPITTGSAVNTKEYIDDKTTLVKSASGSLIHITDGGDNIPLKACEITIEPDLQGKTEANLVVCGKNLLPPYNLSGSGTLTINSNNGVYSIAGTTSSYRNEIASDSFFLKAGTYTFKNLGNRNNYMSAQLRSVDGQTTYANSGTVSNTFTLTETTEVKFRFTFQANNTYNEICKPELEIGNEANTFNQYNGTIYNIPFGQTVYGGSGNALTGEFESTFGFVEFDGSNDEDWHLSGTYDWNVYINIPTSKPLQFGDMLLCKAGNNIVPTTPSGFIEENKCNISTNRNFQIGILGTLGITTLEDWRTWLSSNHIKVAFTLETPTSLTLSGVTPKTISGVNNIYNDCGSTAIEYFTSSADGLAALIEVLSNS